MLTPDRVQLLQKRWITTVEAVIAAANTDEGKSGLAKSLGMSAVEVGRLLEKAREVVGTERYTELSTPKRGGPTGALLSEEDKRKYGAK